MVDCWCVLLDHLTISTFSPVSSRSSNGVCVSVHVWMEWTWSVHYIQRWHNPHIGSFCTMLVYTHKHIHMRSASSYHLRTGNWQGYKWILLIIWRNHFSQWQFFHSFSIIALGNTFKIFFMVDRMLKFSYEIAFFNILVSLSVLCLCCRCFVKLWGALCLFGKHNGQACAFRVQQVSHTPYAITILSVSGLCLSFQSEWGCLYTSSMLHDAHGAMQF